jgi:transposase
MIGKSSWTVAGSACCNSFLLVHHGFCPPPRRRRYWPRSARGTSPAGPGGSWRQLAAELLADIIMLDRKLKDSDRRLREAVAPTGSGLPDLYGIGPVGAARILGDVGDVARFRSKTRAVRQSRASRARYGRTMHVIWGW